MVPVLKNIEERSTARNYRPFRLIDHVEKCGLFSDFQYGFRSSQLTADLQTVYLIELLGLLTGLWLFFFSQE